MGWRPDGQFGVVDRIVGAGTIAEFVAELFVGLEGGVFAWLEGGRDILPKRMDLLLEHGGLLVLLSLHSTVEVLA